MPESFVVNFETTSSIAVTDCSGVRGLPSHSGYPDWNFLTYPSNISLCIPSAEQNYISIHLKPIDFDDYTYADLDEC